MHSIYQRLPESASTEVVASSPTRVAQTLQPEVEAAIGALSERRFTFTKNCHRRGWSLERLLRHLRNVEVEAGFRQQGGQLERSESISRNFRMAVEAGLAVNRLVPPL